MLRTDAARELFPRRFDLALLGAVLTLALLGVAFVASAAPPEQPGAALRQLFYVGLALVIMVVAARVDYRLLVESSPLLFVLVLGVLGAMPFLAPTIAGTRAWIPLGPIRIQPSEPARIVTILLLARLFENHDASNLDWRAFFRIGLVVALPMGLVAMQNDLGMAATFVPLAVVALFLGGLRLRAWMALVIGGLLLAAGLYAFALKDYQRQRIRTFVDPAADRLGAGYQVWQSKIAIGSGGLTGKGYRQGTQSGLGFLPARHTDFIFAVVAEELGFFGVTTVLGLIGFTLLRILTIAHRARDRSGAFLSAGIAGLFAFHVFVNAGMVLGLMPNTGITFPFLSYGGSSLLSNAMAVGLVLSVEYRRFANA